MKKKKNPAAQALGRLGGKARVRDIGVEGLRELASKGGKARLKAMTPEERTALAVKAAKASAAVRKQRKKEKKSQ